MKNQKDFDINRDLGETLVMFTLAVIGFTIALTLAITLTGGIL